MSFYPVEKLVFPLATFLRPYFLAGTEAMVSRLILDVTVVDMVSRQGGIKQHGIVVFHNRVVDAIDKEDGRAIGGNVIFQ